MPVLRQIIDVLAQGGDRPVRRLIAYYLFIGMIVFALVYFVPSVAHLLAGKGLEPTQNTAQLLQDGLSKKQTQAAMLARHPELYEEMKKFFRQDPVTFSSETL